MTKLLYANNASTTLQSGLTSTATTIVLATGTGSLFPGPADASQAFYMTLVDAETQQTREIVYCTARSADVCTVVRGQQGTTAAAWSAGDLISQLFTMADADNMVQPDELLQNVYLKATPGGTVNSLTASINSGLLDVSDMLSFVMPAIGANTGAVTLTLTLGTTTLASHPVQKFGGSNLNANDIPAAGYPMELIWSDTLSAFIMTNPATGTAGSISGGAANELLVQTAPGTTGFIPAPTIAGTVLAWSGSALVWLAAAVTSFNGRAGAVVPQAGDYTATMVGAVPESAFQAPNISHNNPGFVEFPDGTIMQYGNRSITPNSATAVSFGKIFPNACVSVVVSCNNQSSAIEVDSFTTSSFNCRVNANLISWVAFGY